MIKVFEIRTFSLYILNHNNYKHIYIYTSIEK